MAQRYAKLDENNVVIGEVLLDDSACGSSEAEAVASLQKMYGWQFWKRTYFGTEEGETNPRITGTYLRVRVSARTTEKFNIFAILAKYRKSYN